MMMIDMRKCSTDFLGVVEMHVRLVTLNRDDSSRRKLGLYRCTLSRTSTFQEELNAHRLLKFQCIVLLVALEDALNSWTLHS